MRLRISSRIFYLFFAALFAYSCFSKCLANLPFFEGSAYLSNGRIEKGRLTGKIIAGRYHSFDNLFSLNIPMAIRDGFVEDHGMTSTLAGVTFFNSYGYLLKIQSDEVIPEVKSLISNYPHIKAELLDAIFYEMLIPQLTEAIPDIKILHEKKCIIGNGEPALYAVLNMPKVATLVDAKTGIPFDSKRGYLLFFSRDTHLVNFSMQDTLTLIPSVAESANFRLNERLYNHLIHIYSSFKDS